VDPRRLGGFWAGVLGLELHEREDGLVHLDGRTPQHRVWVNRVPEPVTVKQRVHLDVHTRSVDDVLALGATPLDTTSFRWQVLRDPEGGELCTFERPEVASYRLYEVVVDCADPAPVARWWAEVLGGRLDHEDDVAWWWVEEVPGMPFGGLVFVPVEEPKTVKNRIHWDVQTDDLDALVAHGARVLRPRDADISWTVMADPDGNEFCAFAAG
jgi:catechol 2,3-dioxygenase-like lactoylglutathione lyase family enzyme